MLQFWREKLNIVNGNNKVGQIVDMDIQIHTQIIIPHGLLIKQIVIYSIQGCLDNTLTQL